MCFPLNIVFEHVQPILDLDRSVVQAYSMRDLVLLFDQIQLLLDGGVILVFILPDLEKHLDHILNTFVDVSLVQDAAKLIKDR